MDYTKIGQIVSKAIVDSTEYILAKGNFDKTFPAMITGKESKNKYTIKYNGKDYTVKGVDGIPVGEYVKVCAPQNNWSELFISQTNFQKKDYELPDDVVKEDSIISLEEINESEDLDGKIPNAEAVKILNNDKCTVTSSDGSILQMFVIPMVSLTFSEGVCTYNLPDDKEYAPISVVHFANANNTVVTSSNVSDKTITIRARGISTGNVYTGTTTGHIIVFTYK